MSKIAAYTKDNFQSEVLDAQGVTVVRFWAAWCGPCTAMKPIFHDVANELASHASFGEVDIDSSPEIANAFGIRSIPTVLVFKDGKPVDGIVGGAPKNLLIDNIRGKL